jgi:hypothetical protein|tara:strand:- start:1550 stop:1747 length:198 start_codon:yes stop_codon:yes gene_type:complete
MTIFTKEFWLDTAGERAVKTVAQTAIATLGGGSIGLFAIDWASLASISLGAGLLSVLTSIVTKSK